MTSYIPDNNDDVPNIEEMWKNIRDLASPEALQKMSDDLARSSQEQLDSMELQTSSDDTTPQLDLSSLDSIELQTSSDDAILEIQALLDNAILQLDLSSLDSIELQTSSDDISSLSSQEPSDTMNKVERHPNPTVDTVVDWMCHEITINSRLSHINAVQYIIQYFNRSFLKLDNTNRILADVLKAFRKRTPDVVWAKHGLYWRKRQQGDPEKGRVVDE